MNSTDSLQHILHPENNSNEVVQSFPKVSIMNYSQMKKDSENLNSQSIAEEDG